MADLGDVLSGKVKVPDGGVPDANLVEAGARALAVAREDTVFADPAFSDQHWDGARDLYREDAATVLAAAQQVTPPTPVGDLLRADAQGRREYANNAGPGPIRDILELQAATLEQAAQVADGDLKPLYNWLPSWRWTAEMSAALDAKQEPR